MPSLDNMHVLTFPKSKEREKKETSSRSNQIHHTSPKQPQPSQIRQILRKLHVQNIISMAPIPPLPSHLHASLTDQDTTIPPLTILAAAVIALFLGIIRIKRHSSRTTQRFRDIKVERKVDCYRPLQRRDKCKRAPRAAWEKKFSTPFTVATCLMARQQRPPRTRSRQRRNAKLPSSPLRKSWLSEELDN